MRIGILGPLDVRDAAARPVEVGGRRLRALLIRLAAEAGRPVSADRLLDDLWDGAPPGGNALQALVSRLRGVAGRDVVEHGPAGYRLGIDPGEIDAVAFERGVASARAERDAGRRADGLRAALALWRGPALADVADADFARATITRLEELRLAAVEDRIDAETAAGLPFPPVAELEPLAAANPLRERLRGQLMRALYAAGRQADALEVYEETRRALADRLGVDPSPELAGVHLSILRREPAAAPAALEPASALPRSARTNLPAQLTSFVGREEESKRVCKQLRETRLVTLTGPGGAGKTRLAEESAAALLDEMPDGVWFVPLAPVTDPDDVVQALLSALSVPETVRPAETRAAVRPLERLTDFLATKRTVVVLDNCEHLVDAVARLADHLVAQADGLRILATSREPLGITGEALCPVPSLPLPDEDVTAPADALGYASVRLFADRAAAVRPGFAVDGSTVADVVAICRALDGIPLAIELAAARLRSLTSGQVAARLGDRFRLLAGGSRTALPRHRTLRAVVDWSWDLLDDVERVVLRRLSVFAGGATPDAAVHVCALDAPDPHDVIDVIAALIDKSLVMADGDTDVRYRLLETVRVYAGERLEQAGETRRVRDAHVAYLVGLAERAEPELRRRDQLRWASRLAAERENFTIAFRHVTETRDVESGLRLVAGLVWFWVVRDMEREASGWTFAVRDMAGDTAPPGLEEEYALCVVAANVVREMTVEPGPTAQSMHRTLEDATARMPEAPMHPMLALARPALSIFTGDMEEIRGRMGGIKEHPDPWVRAVARVVLAHVGINLGDLSEAAEGAADGYARFHELGDRFGMIVALSAMVHLAMARGEMEEAVRLGDEAYEYATTGVSPEQGSAILAQLAKARAQLGDTVRARAELERAVAQTERIGEFADAAGCSLLLCELALLEGDRDDAREHADRAYKWVESRGHRADFVQASRRTFSRLGCLAEEDGDLEAARRWHGRALGGLENDPLMGNPNVASLIEGLAAYAAACGAHVRAAELLGTAHSLHGYRDMTSHEVRRTLPAVREVLGEDAFSDAYERGRRITRGEVFEQAGDLVASV
ncbi:BTAD domain-containing putative transcriptional regulator [Actinomadura sp. B10D3]|uniref:BTAD domain-containing putative transcriptional regulator n=1 Tax=Actinomadura sp. B10D3 TaxID=3153557 RepID=UPI00325F4CC7